MTFEQLISQNETIIRLSFFFGIFAVMAVWEFFTPCRKLTVSKSLRWANNLGLVFLNSIMLRMLFPAAAVGVAVWTHSQGWGLLPLLDLPLVVAILASIVLMDFVIYLQHVMVHSVPLLWRLHRVHHADPDFDVTTGARFHPLEILLSMLIKFATIILLGPPVVAVVLFEVILNAMAMFNHSNIRLPRLVDKWMRIFFVTPDMHRVHHSIEDDEANSNFGFNLAIWDRLLGTYRDQPRLGHTQMKIGIRGYVTAKQVTTIPGMLTLPFKGRITGYAINRRQWHQAGDTRDES